MAKSKVASDYVGQPKGAYGSKSGLTPALARTRKYDPNLATGQAATTGKHPTIAKQPTEAFETKHK